MKEVKVTLDEIAAAGIEKLKKEGVFEKDFAFSPEETEKYHGYILAMLRSVCSARTVQQLKEGKKVRLSQEVGNMLVRP